ncbi:class I SAM-dependent methyltransferase [Nocardioidaceae bacterium SCSIO 66511]|nr:class I SAM-dependent methyltransferase [Nocardioidaceae bacterium SCSIO 66511]
MDEQSWDARYEERESIWSGRPNGALTVEAAELEPGQALDVGCGEGGDAVWLAERGWQVTAVDISKVALDRAAARSYDNAIAWKHGDLTQSAPPPTSFDLVSAQYFPLPRANPEAARGLIDAVAPGGTLLYVGHDLSTMDEHHHRDWDGPDPRDYFTPAEIAELLDEAWEIEVNEQRPRVDTPESSGHFAEDLVLRARRLR